MILRIDRITYLITKIFLYHRLVKLVVAKHFDSLVTVLQKPVYGFRFEDIKTALINLSIIFIVSISQTIQILISREIMMAYISIGSFLCTSGYFYSYYYKCEIITFHD